MYDPWTLTKVGNYGGGAYRAEGNKGEKKWDNSIINKIYFKK